MRDPDIPQADRDWYVAEARSWEALGRELADVRTFAEAERVVFTGPGSGRPGHRFYANLGYFLARQFAIPPTSSRDERQLYAGLVRRIEQAGEISTDAYRRVVKALEDRLRHGGG